jgi:hypothetical protein
VFCPDMAPDESVLFKQFDFRAGGVSQSKNHIK